MEKAHDISLDEPCVAHQAILFMLDVLMRNNATTLTLDELYDSFGDKSFTPQMLRAVGGNEQGLRQFLIRYPSLFTVTGDSVSANSGGSQLPRMSGTSDRYLRKTNKSSGSKTPSSVNTSDSNSDNTSSSVDLINSSSSSSSTSSTPPSTEPQYDSKTMKEIEQEAIAFFRKQISKREEDWLPIVSVAGHASQSSSDVRKFVGPQNEFKSFLVKYPHIFVVREEYCGLKGKADVSTQPFPPPSPPPKRRMPQSVNLLGGNSLTNSTLNGSVFNRTQSFKGTNRYSIGNILPANSNSLSTSLINSQSLLNHASSALSNNLMNSISNSSTSNLAGNVVSGGGIVNKPRLTPVEVKAVHYVMRILHKNGRMLLQTIPGLISRAPDQVSNIVGFTREDLIQFFKRHSAIFQLHPDGCVSVKQDAVKALILKDNSAINGNVNGCILNSGINGSTNGNILNNNLSNGGISNGLNSGSMDPNAPSGIIINNGVVLRIFPKYGILNMDNNEQVFFDIQSCQFETFSDLTTILHTGDRLHFNAIIGPRDGSTKWRSLKTWIKMKPQQSNSNNNIIGLLDNVSSHSDADKSDDSSTSSHGNNLSNGRTHLQQNGNIYQSSHSNQPNGSYYIITGANLGSNGQNTPSVPFASSPTANINGSINNLAINDSISNISTPTNTIHSNLTGDFNQYQLEILNQNNDTLNDSTISLTSSMSATNLVHSSSATNLNSNNVTQLDPNSPNTHTTSFSSSKSIHSFSNEQHHKTDLKKLTDEKDSKIAGTVASTGSITQFMKQSADNISKREISSANTTMVSIGCQTISTGDVTVTNIFIE